MIEEGDSVVGDVVVKPSEDGAGFVCERWEGCSELLSEPSNVSRWDGLAWEACSVVVWAGEVST